MRRFFGLSRRQGGEVGVATATPPTLGVSNVFDSFEAVMRLAEMTGVADEFGEYAATRKTTLFYDVTSLDRESSENRQHDGMFVDRRERRAERRGGDRRATEQHGRQTERAHVMGADASERRSGERRMGDRRSENRRRSKEN